jgi:hypothetical protein
VAKPTGFGYSKNAYRVVQIGASDPAVKESVSIGYDPSGNAWASFGGDGREILVRRGARIICPNSANDSFFYHLYMIDGHTVFGSVLTPSADGRTQIRTWGLVGGSIVWDYNGVDGTARTVMPHNAQDVVSPPARPSAARYRSPPTPTRPCIA